MRYIMIYRPDADMETSGPPTPENMEAMGKFIQEIAEAGVLVGADGLLPSSMGAKVRLSNGKLTVTDGPFTEAREVIGGFAIVQLDSMAEAVDLAERFLKVAGDGSSEIRQMHDQPAFERQ